MKRGSAGIGFVGLLQIALIVLKLCKVIDWGWIWVFSPFWIEVIVIGIAFILVLRN